MENIEDKKHDDEKTSYARIEPYTNPAGGWGRVVKCCKKLKETGSFQKRCDYPPQY